MIGFSKGVLVTALLLGTANVHLALAENFPDVRPVETQLVRGVSTKQDALDLIGPPDGVGYAVFPPDHRRQRVWFYEDNEIEGISRAIITSVPVEYRQQILLLFFEGDRFNGFSWTSNVISGSVKRGSLK